MLSLFSFELALILRWGLRGDFGGEAFRCYDEVSICLMEILMENCTKSWKLEGSTLSKPQVFTVCENFIMVYEWNLYEKYFFKQ